MSYFLSSLHAQAVPPSLKLSSPQPIRLVRAPPAPPPVPYNVTQAPDEQVRVKHAPRNGFSPHGSALLLSPDNHRAVPSKSTSADPGPENLIVQTATAATYLPTTNTLAPLSRRSGQMCDHIGELHEHPVSLPTGRRLLAWPFRGGGGQGFVLYELLGTKPKGVRG